jgi:hypothetical protein
MGTVLVIVTLVSLVMTIVLGAIVAKLLRNERRRSDARVAMLVQMSDAAATSAPIAADEEWQVAEEEEWPERTIAVSDDLFVAPDAHSPWARRIGIVAALALVVTLIGMAVRSSLPARTPASAEASSGVPVAAQPSAGVLELLSLKHDQHADTLTITGLVQNPRDGATLSKIAATVLLFGADGTFLASGRAPLDFTTLRPGDESGFVISVQVSVPVARYRVGFRGDDGRIIGHVDRRGTAALAQNHGQ